MDSFGQILVANFPAEATILSVLWAESAFFSVDGACSGKIQRGGTADFWAEICVFLRCYCKGQR